MTLVEVIVKRAMDLFVAKHTDYLANELNNRMGRRKLYSQRAFARDLELSVSTLNEYLRGRLKLSEARISTLSKSIGLNTEQKNHWIDLIKLETSKDASIKQEAKFRVDSRLSAQTHSISMDQFKLVSNWYHFAYTELLKIDAVKYSSVTKASKALGIKPMEMNKAIQRLLRLGLITKNAEGVFEANDSYRMGDTVPSLAVRQFHKQLISKARASLDEQPMETRFVSSTLVALPKSEVDNIMADIKTLALRYLDKNLNSASRGSKVKKEKLYCMTLQFFNLLQEEEK